MSAFGPGPTGHPLVLYDGVCGLCNRLVRFLLRRDRDARFRFAWLQGGLAASVLARHGMAPPAGDSSDSGTLYVVLEFGQPGERLLARSEAVLFVLRELPRWRVLAALFGLLPRRLRDVLYNLVARHRYRLFGRYDTCPAPPPQERERFLGD